LPSRGEENTIFISKKKNITVGQSQPNYVYTYIYMYKDNGSMNASINNNSGQYCPQTIYHGNWNTHNLGFDKKIWQLLVCNLRESFFERFCTKVQNRVNRNKHNEIDLSFSRLNWQLKQWCGQNDQNQNII
jgi:hypothetical protein